MDYEKYHFCSSCKKIFYSCIKRTYCTFCLNNYLKKRYNENKINCNCGSVISKLYYEKHLKSKLHNNKIAKITYVDNFLQKVNK